MNTAGKVLGKITMADFGTDTDYPFLLGVHLRFSLSDGGRIGCGGKYTVNISDECRWSDETEKNKAYECMLKHLEGVLKDAKVNKVSELVGKPVEVFIERNTFLDFRILTEVL